MDDPVTLDTRRGIGARKETEERRKRGRVASDLEAVQARQARLEHYLHGGPSGSWREVAEKARYLIEILAATPGALDPQRQQLVADVLAELGAAARPPSPDNDRAGA
ncbi:MAG TPA: hypothetical protein VHD15_17825 [Hyphomicrobiales bacterium]|nr:hypothetical protein [Hyphomicrobiales bacterium]